MFSVIFEVHPRPGGKVGEEVGPGHGAVGEDEASRGQMPKEVRVAEGTGQDAESEGYAKAEGPAPPEVF